MQKKNVNFRDSKNSENIGKEKISVRLLVTGKVQGGILFNLQQIAKKNSVVG